MNKLFCWYAYEGSVGGRLGCSGAAGMRGQLSKVSGLAMDEELDVQCGVEGGRATSLLHYRRKTLLYQSLPSPRSSSSSAASTASSSASSASTSTSTNQSTATASSYDGFQVGKFLNVFSSFSAEEDEKLARLWAECHGALPSRRQLSEIARALGVAQNRIRKYFERRQQEQCGAGGGRAVLSAEAVGAGMGMGTSANTGTVVAYNCAPHKTVEDEFWREMSARMDGIDAQMAVTQAQLQRLLGGQPQ